MDGFTTAPRGVRNGLPAYGGYVWRAKDSRREAQAARILARVRAQVGVERDDRCPKCRYLPTARGHFLICVEAGGVS